jgi:hypothetical protein
MVTSVASSGNYKIYQNYPYSSQPLYSFNMNSISDFVGYSRKLKTFFVADNYNVYSYPLTCAQSTMILVNEGYCRTCPLNCSQCDYQGICTFCNANFNLESTNNTCVSNNNANFITPSNLNISNINNASLNSSNTTGTQPNPPNANNQNSSNINNTSLNSSNTTGTQPNPPNNNATHNSTQNSTLNSNSSTNQINHTQNTNSSS